MPFQSPIYRLELARYAYFAPIFPKYLHILPILYHDSTHYAYLYTYNAGFALRICK